MDRVKEGFKLCAGGCGGWILDEPKWSKCQKCELPLLKDETERQWQKRAGEYFKSLPRTR